MKRKGKPRDPVKALKKAARDAFGFQVTRISENRKKYARSREKRQEKAAVLEGRP